MTLNLTNIAVIAALGCGARKPVAVRGSFVFHSTFAIMTTRSKALKDYTEEAEETFVGFNAPGFVVQLYAMVNESPPDMISVSSS